MPQYKIDNDRVLIIPGYTDQEILQNTQNTKKTKTSGKSTTTTIQTNKQKITKPTGLFIEVHNVQYTPHIKSYEDFNSAEGLIKIEKACDRFAEVEMEVLVHQNISNTMGNILIDKETRQARLRVADNSLDTTDSDLDGFSRWVKPEEFTEEYIELRSGFFNDLVGRPLTIVSPLFPPMYAAYMTECNYTIGDGEEEASYSVTFSEVENIGI